MALGGRTSQPRSATIGGLNMTIDLDELERLARAATHGERHISGRRIYGCRPNRATGYTLGEIFGEADRQFIVACSPDRILALIRELRQARETIEIMAKERTP